MKHLSELTGVANPLAPEEEAKVRSHLRTIPTCEEIGRDSITMLAAFIDPYLDVGKILGA